MQAGHGAGQGGAGQGGAARLGGCRPAAVAAAACAFMGCGCRYAVAGYTEHMDERGEVREAPPFEKVAEDWGAMGEQWLKINITLMPACCWQGLCAVVAPCPERFRLCLLGRLQQQHLHPPRALTVVLPIVPTVLASHAQCTLWGSSCRLPGRRPAQRQLRRHLLMPTRSSSGRSRRNSRRSLSSRRVSITHRHHRSSRGSSRGSSSHTRRPGSGMQRQVTCTAAAAPQAASAVAAAAAAPVALLKRAPSTGASRSSGNKEIRMDNTLLSQRGRQGSHSGRVMAPPPAAAAAPPAVAATPRRPSHKCPR